MIRKDMFVRCDYDIEYPDCPREYYCGKVLSVNVDRNTAFVAFYDINGISKFYEIPEAQEYNIQQLTHCSVITNAIVKYKKKKYIVKASNYDKKDDLYYYYISDNQSEIIKTSEYEIIASINDGVINPVYQIVNYEFQNPVFYFGHANVSRKMQIIDNSLYGFKELAGCKVFLKPHQLTTVMRCLRELNCRIMLADEVGLGKTIEALSTLKIFLLHKTHQKVAVVVPDFLIEQWKVEAAFKFKLFDGDNTNNNFIDFLGFNSLKNVLTKKYDFIIVDEIHRLLVNSDDFNDLLMISKNTNNIIMLSATPIQKRKEEYQKLLTLIQPDKYENMNANDFSKLIDLQTNIVRKAHDALESIDTLFDEIRDRGYEHTVDSKFIFDDILTQLTTLQTSINNDVFEKMIDDINYNADNFDIDKIQTAISFVCENYQLEKSIVRNRRSLLFNDNERVLKDLSYDAQVDFNNTEYNIYNMLSDWFQNTVFEDDIIKIKILKAFFSSARAFDAVLKEYQNSIEIPLTILDSSKKWIIEENKILLNIFDYVDNVEQESNRLLTILNCLDLEYKNGKVLLFTNNCSTFELYKEAMIEFFGTDCCAFFCKTMDSNELETNVYRFQNEKDCMFLLSDESGGEGRNFQNAHMVVHIDIPWSANELEQRIGRLDRIGRKSDFPVVSLVSYSKNTLESDLFDIWDKGLNIFIKSQSGLEIIMNDIDSLIIDAISKDFKYGLYNINSKIIEMIKDMTKSVKQERYFDLALYKYSSTNKVLDKTIELFNKEETTLFADSMMSWSALTGFKGKKLDNGCISFTTDSISINSMRKTLFIPPNFKALIDSKLNQIYNRVRTLGVKNKIPNNDCIIGTFDRNYAVSNDYIHFYSPGDEIFDSIVNNALNSYKGKSSAFAINSKIKWSGFVYIWKLCIDDFLVYENKINETLINQYRGYLPQEEYISVVPIMDTSIDSKDVKSEFKRLFTLNVKKECVHYGKRESKYQSAFYERFPKEKWIDIVTESYEFAKNEIEIEVKEKLKFSMDELRIELLNTSGIQKALSIYYKRTDDFEKIKKESDAIESVISNPKLVLDSICFVDMVNDI